MIHLKVDGHASPPVCQAHLTQPDIRMKGPRHEDAVRRSALAWLKRLGWNYLSFEHYGSLTGHPENVLLSDRVRAIVRRGCLHAGRPLTLPDDTMDAILRKVADLHAGAPWPVASAATLHLLRTGVSVDVLLADGERITLTLPLIDWAHPNRNHWDVADDLRGCGQSRTGDIRDLVCFVNGIPLALIACVERDSHRHWGRMEKGAAHLLRCLRAAALDPLPRQAQLLISLDRRGGYHAGAGVPAHAWARWREAGWDTTAAAQRRDVAVRQCDGPPDVPLLTHAELLCGLLTPARLLRLLHRYVQASPGMPIKLARAAQFFAVEAALAHLQGVLRHGRNSDAQVCLAPGSGMQRAREWLAAAVQDDLPTGTFRLLMPVHYPSRSLPAWARGPRVPLPAAGLRQLRAFLDADAPAPLQVSVDALARWTAAPHATALSGHGVVLLLDDSFWAQPEAFLIALRRCLPVATWLTFTPAPIDVGPGCPHPGTVIYQYREEQAVADGVVVPVLCGPRGPQGLQDTCADLITRHFRSRVLDQQRDLRATVLVDTDAQAQALHATFATAGQLRSRVRHLDARGHCRERSPAVPPAGIQLEICSGSLPALQESRLAVAYVERALSRVEHARLLGLINQPHPDKHAALLVWGHPAAGHVEATGAAPSPVDDAANLQHAQRRLAALLPPVPGRDRAACLERVMPRWEVTPLGEDRDAHRQRRHLLRRRVTRLGVALQHAGPAGHCLSADSDVAARRDLRFHAEVDEAAACLALETGEYEHEDTRVRHWLRESALQVHEPSADYAAATGEGSLSPRASRCYAELRAELEHPGEEPGRVESARRELQAILRDHPEPRNQVTALAQFHARLPALLGHAGPQQRSRAYLLLEGILGSGAGLEHHGPLIRLIEATVRSGHRLLPDEPQPFRQHIRASLRSALEHTFGTMRAELILDALISRAPHWPSTAQGMTGGT